MELVRSLQGHAMNLLTIFICKHCNEESNCCGNQNAYTTEKDCAVRVCLVLLLSETEFANTLFFETLFRNNVQLIMQHTNCFLLLFEI